MKFLVDWPINAGRIVLYGRPPKDWRIILHFACINEDAV